MSKQYSRSHSTAQDNTTLHFAVDPDAMDARLSLVLRRNLLWLGEVAVRQLPRGRSLIEYVLVVVACKTPQFRHDKCLELKLLPFSVIQPNELQALLLKDLIADPSRMAVLFIADDELYWTTHSNAAGFIKEGRGLRRILMAGPVRSLAEGTARHKLGLRRATADRDGEGR